MNSEHPIWRRRCSGLMFIGAGMPERYALTLEAIKALKACKVVFINHGWNPDYFKRWCREVNVLENHQVGSDYSGQVDHILSALERGSPVGVIYYGHPMLYGSEGEIIEECRRRKIPFSVVSGTSAIDAVLSATGTLLKRGSGICVGDLHYFNQAPLDRISYLLVYRPAQNQELYMKFLRKCLEVHPKEHPIAFIECGNGETTADQIAWTSLRGATRRFQRMSPNTTLFVLSNHDPRAKRPEK